MENEDRMNPSKVSLPFSDRPDGGVLTVVTGKNTALRAVAKRVVCVVAVVFAGCASSTPTTQPTTPDQRQEAILNDPMGYKPAMDHDISGGDISHFGKGLNNDINDVLNP